MCEGCVKGVCEGGQWGSSGGEVLPCGAVRCGVVRCGMMRCGAVGYDAYGVRVCMVCGVGGSVEWYDAVRCGAVQMGMSGGKERLAAPAIARRGG